MIGYLGGSFKLVTPAPKPARVYSTAQGNRKRWGHGHSLYRMLIGNHTKSIEWYHFQCSSVTSDPDFKVTIFWKSNIVKTA